MIPKAATLNREQVNMLPLTNVHFHLGAEHKSEAYFNGTMSEAYDQSPHHEGHSVRPGFMCSTEGLNSTQLAPYEFKCCKGVSVGKSFETHYVHSSAGQWDGALSDGLGYAANGRGELNPMVAVEGQVYQIVQGAPYIPDMLHKWSVEDDPFNAVMYPGSTTGTSFDNEVCSPYTVTWHVGLKCYQVSPESFDNMCCMMQFQHGMHDDLAAHGSRILVDPAYVVPSKFVKPMM
jgi:hypothetical protein